jgi:hypothetical protein
MSSAKNLRAAASGPSVLKTSAAFLMTSMPRSRLGVSSLGLLDEVGLRE